MTCGICLGSGDPDFVVEKAENIELGGEEDLEDSFGMYGTA